MPEMARPARAPTPAALVWNDKLMGCSLTMLARTLIARTLKARQIVTECASRLVNSTSPLDQDGPNSQRTDSRRPAGAQRNLTCP